MTDVRLDPPFPTESWLTLLASPEARRLGAAHEPLAVLYAAVAAANHRGAQVTVLLQTAALAVDDDTRQAFRTVAQSFAGPTNAEVLRAASVASPALIGKGK
jgi:hypothetical protein